MLYGNNNNKYKQISSRTFNYLLLDIGLSLTRVIYVRNILGHFPNTLHRNQTKRNTLQNLYNKKQSFLETRLSATNLQFSHYSVFVRDRGFVGLL